MYNLLRHWLYLEDPSIVVIKVKNPFLPQMLIIANKVIGVYFKRILNPLQNYYRERFEEAGIKVIVSNDIEVVKKEIKNIISIRGKE